MHELLALKSLFQIKQGVTLGKQNEEQGTLYKMVKLKNLDGLEIKGPLEQQALSINVEKHLLHKGQVLISARGSIKASVVTEEFEDSLAALNLVVLTPRPHPFTDPYYFAGLINSNHIQRQLERLMGGTTVTSLNTKTLREFKIPVPPQEVQKCLADVFKSLELYKKTFSKLIELREERLEVELERLFEGVYA